MTTGKVWDTSHLYFCFFVFLHCNQYNLSDYIISKIVIIIIIIIAIITIITTTIILRRLQRFVDKLKT